MRTRLMVTGITLLIVAMVSPPSLASDPAEQGVTVPTRAGQSRTLDWTGTIPPGQNEGDCTEANADVHEVKLRAPAGVYDNLRVQATFSISYDGPLTDVKVTVVKPDEKVTTGDAGFVNTDENVGLANPATGTYTVLACMYAGAVPQDYQGQLVLEASEAVGPNTGPACPAPARSPKFREDVIDPTRAGGEPIVTTLDDGTLLWGSHAGTTHFFGPAAPDPGTAAFVQNYQGQTYQYFSEDNGKTWEFVPRTPINSTEQLAGVPASGFSDPEFAVDAAGQVYISEINLANVAVSKSTDGGRSYGVANPLAFTSSDRQWMAADAKDVLYMTANGFGGGSFPGGPAGNLGHFFAKSTDGGTTWSAPITSNPNGVADIQVDPRDGTLYEISADAGEGANTGTGVLGMAAFRKIRDETENFSDPEISTIADNVGYSSIGRLIDPTFDMDAEGNLYIVWTENGTGERPAGIWYSYSTDRAKSWAAPIRVDPGKQTDIWPWISVGEPGKVSIVYLATDAVLENNNAELAAEDDEWHVISAHTFDGLGCGRSEAPGFNLTQASKDPVHRGTICMGGTVCQAQLIDRRLGDYFANEIDGQGHTYISVSTTTPEEAGGAVALPLVIRQVSGPRFATPQQPGGGGGGGGAGGGGAGGGTTDPGDEATGGGDGSNPVLPATGGGALVLLGAVLTLLGVALRRQRPAPANQESGE